MGSERNAVFGNSTVGGVSDSEGELLYTLAKGVPLGQVIVALNSSEDEAAAWLARGANEATGNNVHSVNIRYADYETMSRRCKEKVGLLWYNASCEYEDVRKALLSWQRHLSAEAMVVLQGYQRLGVVRVIREYIGSYGNFVFIDSVGTIAVLAVDRCVHYWVIDRNEFGICKYCGRKRDFGRMSSEWSQTETQKRVNGRKSK
jgi:hypothetical protein